MAAVSSSLPERFHHRNQLAGHERQRDKHRRQHNARQREHDVDIHLLQPRAQIAQRPNISISISPTTTGETENGKSISAVSSVRPGNRNRAISQAAAMPNSVFSTTAIGVTINVSLIECSVAELLIKLCQ